jgi:hypothetical protein
MTIYHPTGWLVAGGTRDRLPGVDVAESLQVEDGGTTIAFTIDDLMRYHGPHSPAGVAVAFKVMQRAFRELSPGVTPQRRSVVVRTAFRGPGARDGFEAVTRGVTEGRYTVDRSLLRADRGRLTEDFVFEVTLGDRSATLLLRDGFVTDEFIDLARTDSRNAVQERRLGELKSELAQQVMATTAADLFDIA